MTYKLLHGDCITRMREPPDNSVDAIVTDPPYELGFMGKRWDASGIAYNVEMWREALRVLKHGGHLLAFGGTRTYHRMVCANEDAGFEIRDCLMWVFAEGFPKSHDVSKAIDKAAGAEREIVGENPNNRDRSGHNYNSFRDIGSNALLTAPATPAAQQWEGWGTALKPAYEPIVLARKPIVGTVAENVLQFGTGGINIDDCRVGAEERFNPPARNKAGGNSLNMSAKGMPQDAEGRTAKGRWPANFIHDGSDEVLELFPVTKSGSGNKGGRNTTAFFGSGSNYNAFYDGDSGSAARFFYCAKASKTDRDEGCEGLEVKTLRAYGDFAGTPEHGPKQNVKARNYHPTVKPTELMRYLCRLITPPNGTILDPFMGSGSTGKAAMWEGFNFVGIDEDADYVRIAQSRIEFAIKNPPPEKSKRSRGGRNKKRINESQGDDYTQLRFV